RTTFALSAHWWSQGNLLFRVLLITTLLCWLFWCRWLGVLGCVDVCIGALALLCDFFHDNDSMFLASVVIIILYYDYLDYSRERPIYPRHRHAFGLTERLHC
ncbi:hypothetical protein L914_20735, partial [Phytophthora nicotianae]